MKKPLRRWTLSLGTLLLIAIFLLMLIYLLFESDLIDAVLALRAATPPAATAATATAPVSKTAAPTPRPSPDYSAIAPYLGDAGIDRLPDDTGQLVVVDGSGSGSRADVYLFELYDLTWTENTGLRATAYVGRNGIGEKQREGDGMTPQGLFPVREAFYWGEFPDTGLELLELTRDIYWVDDTDSDYYNQRVDATRVTPDWDSALLMYGNDAYRCGFVIGFNEEAEPGAGSVICMRVGSQATGGSVALSQAATLDLIRILDVSKSPLILILQ